MTYPPHIPPPPPPRKQNPGWLLPPAPKQVWWKNPWVIVIGCVFVVGFFGAYWYVAIPLTVIVGGGLVWYFRKQYREREYARLRAAADQAYRDGDVLPPRPPWADGGTMAS